jgi:hypothetical protein
LRLLLPIRYGTERYPDKVARRLRALNITAWIAAPTAAVYAIWQYLDPTPGLWKVATTNLADAVIWAALPLLHRSGSLVAAITLVVTLYTSHFVVISLRSWQGRDADLVSARAQACRRGRALGVGVTAAARAR